MVDAVLTGITFSIVGVIYILAVFLKRRRRAATVAYKGETPEEAAATPEPARDASDPPNVLGKPKTHPKRHGKAKNRPESEFWRASAKGHSDVIASIDFSPSGRHLMSVCRDRSVRRYALLDLAAKNNRHLRSNLEEGEPIAAMMDETGNRLCVAYEDRICVYSLTTDKPVLACTSERARQSFVACACAGTRSVVGLTAEAELLFYDVNTLKLQKHIRTHQLQGKSLAVSGNGLVTLSGWTSDTKVYEVVVSKTGEFVDVVEAMQLTGHKSSLASVSFAKFNTGRALTASKDGHVIVWNTDCVWKRGEEPRPVATFDHDGGLDGTLLSPDGKTAVVWSGADLSIYNVDDDAATRVAHIAAAHEEAISAVAWRPAGDGFASAGGRVCHLWTVK